MRLKYKFAIRLSLALTRFPETPMLKLIEYLTRRDGRQYDRGEWGVTKTDIEVCIGKIMMQNDMFEDIGKLGKSLIPKTASPISTLTGRLSRVSCSHLRQIGAFQSSRRDCTRLRHRKMSRIVSKERASIFIIIH